jgi:TonB-dependent starch-binding outer membrane protein SusC
MEEKMSATNSFRGILSHSLRAIGLSLLFVLAVSGTALSQTITVAGTVTSTAGTPLPGVMVRVQGTDARATTGPTGQYRITAPSDAVLIFSRVGQKPVQTTVAGRSTVDVAMAQISYLEEVVVTGYQEQRRGDITGAVAIVNVQTAQKGASASVLKALDATVPGVTVVTSGSPGARNTVRIRGISSFQNNDPLYIIDGMAVSDSYINWLNPDDIASIQVLKDASASSIYGARAGNGVVLIETTRRGVQGPPRVTLRARTGIASPVRGYDDILITNSLDYFAVLNASYENAGLAVPASTQKIYGDPNNPSVPNYTWAEPKAVVTRNAFGQIVTVDPSKYSYPLSLIMPGSAGTNWWKEVWRPAAVSDYNLDVRGGSDANAYSVSFNYFDQNGTAKYNDFRRGSIRANTSFTRSKLNFGENVALVLNRHYGGTGTFDDASGENGVLGKDILMQPVVSVYDIAGNFAGGRGVPGVNEGNPLKNAFDAKDNITKENQIFGNAFASYSFIPELSVRTNLGFDLRQNSFSGFTNITPEANEANLTNQISEWDYTQQNWVWSNTARYLKTLSSHSFDLLVGQEASGGINRFVQGSMNNLLNSSLDSRYLQDALGDPSTKNVFSTGGRHALLSLFGKVGYSFADKYVASYTLRRDGSSNLAPGHRWGTFPAFGLGWHLSNESFFSGNRYLSDVMLRYGWGVAGNENVPSGRILPQFGGDRGDTFYDISGSNTSIVAGYRQTALGNPDLKWEESKSSNIGADLVLFNGLFNVVFDVYTRTTDNLLYAPETPATTGIAAPPIVNIGKMENKGFDFSIGHRSSWWNVAFNGGHYKNKIVRIDAVTDHFFSHLDDNSFPFRQKDWIINKVGWPIGSFYGFVADGIFKDDADVAAHATQVGAAPGRIKFKDINGDGVVNSDDRTIVGSPHPKFTAGLDLGARRGGWDASMTFFGTYGNKIWENQKEYYVFREFESNVRKDRLANSWTPTNPNAKYPRLDITDGQSWLPSSYYVEDGSYTRLRNMQIGYTLPRGVRYLPGARVYLQGDNLWTHTNYDGLDPALPAANFSKATGDIRDQFLGVDRGSYPSNRIFSIGIVTSF